CGRDNDGFDGFTHNIAVGTDGAVAIHGNQGVARWDTNGNLTWSFPLQNLDVFGVAIDPHGVVHASVVELSSGEVIDLVRFAADGTALPPIEHVANQPHGMFVIDPVG